jgi:uncharacterized membrane protein
MDPRVSNWVEHAATGIEVLAVVLIVGFIAIGSARFVYASLTRRGDALEAYAHFRSQLGRSMLLGLEVLVAADVVRTVGSGATLGSIVPLGLLVVVRTFLTWSLVVEMEGRWPWEARRAAPSSALRRGDPDQQPDADR